MENNVITTNNVYEEGSYVCKFNTVEEANAWLACCNNVIVKDFTMETTRVGLKTKCIKLVYSVMNQPIYKTFQIAEVRKNRIFFGSNAEKFRRSWEKQNAHCTYIKSLKHRWHISIIGGSVGFFRFIKEKYSVLYAV